ncbi:MAG: succinate--CoA ligase subunit alpha [Candidatus Hydrogenedentota bacterium]
MLIDANTRVVVQGITGRDGSFHTRQMLAYGTKAVGGVTPGKGGQTIHGLPVFNSVPEAVSETGAEVSAMYVPAKFARAAMLDAAKAPLKLLVVITDGIPTLDMLEAYETLSAKGIRIIGPNSPGIIKPGQCKVGIMPANIHTPGSIGVVSRSGTLTYEIVYALTEAGMGQSFCAGLGGDAVIGTTFTDILPLFEQDPDTEAVVLVGEIGGHDEVEAARYYRQHMTKPVIGFMAGLTAPPDRQMGHAGAILDEGEDTVAAKIEKMEHAGVPVARLISDVVPLLKG